jgi:hypothetical protein
VGWDEADGIHLCGPLLVMVAAPTRLAVVLLPLMHHLMHDGRDDFAIGAIEKRARVQRNFVDDFVTAAVAEAFGCKESPTTLPTLHREEKPES